MSKNYVKCPNCGYIFDENLTFSWGPDNEGDPTVEHISCPKCFIGTTAGFSCEMCPCRFNCTLEESCGPTIKTSYDSFIYADEPKEGEFQDLYDNFKDY